MRQCKEYKQLIKKISPLFFQKEQLVHIPFFILSLLAKELAKEDKYLIHGACIIINDSLIIIIGPPETGKSSVLLKLFSTKVDKKIYHASDDKFVFDAYKNQILYSNEILSFRDKNLIKSIKKYQKVDILKSRFTNKYYIPGHKSKLNKSIKKILFFKLHLNNVSLVSKKQKSKDFVIDFYGNIVSHIKGVEACSLSPSLVDNQNIYDNLSLKILNWLKKG